MTDSDKREMQAVVVGAVQQAIQRELGQYKVPKEQHYEDHKFIQWWRELLGDIGDSAIKAGVKVMVVAFFTIILSGIYYFFGHR